MLPTKEPDCKWTSFSSALLKVTWGEDSVRAPASMRRFLRILARLLRLRKSCVITSFRLASSLEKRICKISIPSYSRNKERVHLVLGHLVGVLANRANDGLVEVGAENIAVGRDLPHH